ncbi:MAG: hypothetical protein AAGK32_18495, partial [Actinomycetota bacterium]
MIDVGIAETVVARQHDFQQHMEAHGVDTRMVWTGNVLRQPGFRGIEHRAPDGGLPNADRVMEWGVVLPCNPGWRSTLP